MPKTHSRYVCQSCGAAQSGWMGRCPECGDWNTLVETIVEAPRPGGASTGVAGHRPLVLAQSKPQALPDVDLVGGERRPVPMEEVSRVLGGGIVPGSVTLLSGDPGIGKSTLLLQLAGALCETGARVLYASAEESAHQIKLRAQRLGLNSPLLFVAAEARLEQIVADMDEMRPDLVIVDSIQAIHMEGLASSAGSVSQVRECASALVRVAKDLGLPVFVVGHVTKSGTIAGPRVLEHIVDTVLYLEGERFHAFRLLRSVKNRFGSTDEVGVFEMVEQGLAEVTNPSRVFLAERLAHAAGSGIAVTMEGTRPLLVEVQALVSPSSLAYPRRMANGVDTNRLQLLAAVLTKRAGLKLSEQDVYVNLVGGLRVREPAIDLPVAVAIASAYYGRPIHPELAIFGEIGLAGELRSVSHAERRLREAAKLGFQRVLMPRWRGEQSPRAPGVEAITVRTVAEAADLALVK